MVDDRILVARALNGNVDAFEGLIEKYKNQLFNFLVKMTLSRQDAEEILQEVFLRAWNNLYKYNDRWMFSTWIYRIATNTCKTHMKRNRRLKTVPIHDDIPDCSGKNQYNPEYVLDEEERRREVILLIQGLKEKQRIPLILKYVKEFSYYEIGRILGISEEAAKMRVLRAKENICKKYWEKHRGDES